MELYQYFTGDAFFYHVGNMKELTPDILSKVCVMQLSMSGAMGMEGVAMMFTEDGDVILVSFLSVKHKGNITTLGTTKVFNYLNKYFALNKFTNLNNPDKIINGWKGIYTEFGWYIIGKEDIVNKMVQDAEKMCRDNDIDTKFALHYLNLYFPTCAKKALSLQ